MLSKCAEKKTALAMEQSLRYWLGGKGRADLNQLGIPQK